MQNEKDDALVLWARDGDKRAFGELITRYQVMVQRVAYQMVRDNDLARDLAQEALLAAYLSLEHLRDNQRFASWLYGITLNVCRSHLRNRRMKTGTFLDLSGGTCFKALPFSTEPDPHTIAETRELHARVLDAVNALSPENRAATMLFYYDGLSLDEIAAVLRISVGAVKGRLHKSRARLRQELIETYHEYQWNDTNGGRTEMIPVTVVDVVPQELENDDGSHTPIFVVMLYDAQGHRTLPIWVGPSEGNAIALGISGEHNPRPMTYEFIAKLLGAAGATIESVRIDSLQGDVFYAVVTLKHDKSTVEIDARPSDAIALALRTQTPIFVTTAVMEKSGLAVPQSAKVSTPPPGVEKLLESWRQNIRSSQSVRTRSEQEQKQAQTDLVQLVFGKG